MQPGMAAISRAVAPKYELSVNADELVTLRIWLPGMVSIQSAALDILQDSVTFRATNGHTDAGPALVGGVATRTAVELLPPPYTLVVSLPRRVDPDQSSASFKKKKGLLIVTMPGLCGLAVPGSSPSTPGPVSGSRSSNDLAPARTALTAVQAAARQESTDPSSSRNGADTATSCVSPNSAPPLPGVAAADAAPSTEGAASQTPPIQPALRNPNTAAGPLCQLCGQTKPRSAFSKPQLKKAAGKRRCVACVTGADPPHPPIHSGVATPSTASPPVVRARADRLRAADHTVPQNEYVGTFRWGNETLLPPLPPFGSGSPPGLGGWMDYLEPRLVSSINPGDDTVRVPHPSMMDGLSWPLTFLSGLRRFFLSGTLQSPEYLGKGKTLCIAVLGCSSRAEGRILTASNYWEELTHFLAPVTVELWLIGPEMAVSEHLLESPLGDRPGCRAMCFRGGARDGIIELERRHSGTLSAKIVVYVPNPGFGSGDAALRASWVPELRFLLKRKLPVVVSCANDYLDVAGEQAVLQELKANIIGAPEPSPFNAVTEAHGEEGRDGTWSCANSFYYGVHGTTT
jgi:hypothetical protein